MEDTNITITAIEEGGEQASASTLDSQDLMEAIQMLCNWCPGYYPIKRLSREIRSFLALIRIAESSLRLEGNEAGADARLHKYLEALSSLENVEDIKRRLQRRLAIETSKPTNFYPLLFILKNRNPHISYKSIARTFRSPSCVTDFLLWGIPVREAQIPGLAEHSMLLEDRSSLLSPEPPFDPGQTYITASLPKRLQEEISKVGKTLHVSTSKTSNHWSYNWSRALEIISKVIYKYLVELKKVLDDEFSYRFSAIHQEHGKVPLVKGWYEIIAPFSRNSEWSPQQVLFNDQREDWTPDKLFVRNELVAFSCQSPVDYISICIEIPTL
ncbi:hypothetical protein V2G26_010757 [Clonostachys chloroleuca]